MDTRLEYLDMLAQAHNGANESDYIKDGLLYCGVCNTPKQAVIKEPNGEHIRNIMCKHVKEANERDYERFKRERREQIINERRKYALRKNAEWVSATIDCDKYADSNVSKLVRNYIAESKKVIKENIGIVFVGDVDSGKTFYSCCIANAFIDKGYKVYMRTESDLLDELFNADDKVEYVDYLSSVSLLIIDDFGCMRDTPYAMEQIKKIIDARYNSGKPLILTSNLDKGFFENCTDIKYKRICSRIKANCSIVSVTSKNERDKISKDKRKIMKEIFNCET